MLRSWFLLVVLSASGVLLGPVARAEDSAVEASDPVILILGDSLSAGYGVNVDSTWVALLRRKLNAEGYGYRVVNASISGETTGGARSRLERALELHQPQILVIELGGNDGLRGLPLKQIRSNLEAMIQQARAIGSEILLIGMRIPPNYGPAYADQFHAMYGELAKKYQLATVPFFLENVAENSQLMQSDQIHPTSAAQPRLLDNVWPALKALLKKKP